MKTNIIRDASAEAILAELELGARLKSPGDCCTYDQLRERLGKDPRTAPAYGYVMTARRRFERKHDCVLEAVPKQGIKWRQATEVVRDVAERDATHIRRAVKSAHRRQKTVLRDEANLSPDDRKRLYQNLAMAGTLAMFTTEPARRKISEIADRSGKLIGAEAVLQQFS